MPRAGFEGIVELSADGFATAGVVLAGVNAVENPIGRSMIDVSDIDNDFVKRIYGLIDGSYSLSGHSQGESDAGMVLVRSALINRTDLTVRLYEDASKGTYVEQAVLVENRNRSYPVNGSQAFSVSLQGNGAPSFTVA